MKACDCCGGRDVKAYHFVWCTHGIIEEHHEFLCYDWELCKDCGAKFRDQLKPILDQLVTQAAGTPVKPFHPPTQLPELRPPLPK